MPEYKNGSKWNWLLYTLLIVLPFIGGMCFTNALDIRTIQSSRFTHQDGLEIWKEIAQIKGLIAIIDAHLSSNDETLKDLKEAIREYNKSNKVSP